MISRTNRRARRSTIVATCAAFALVAGACGGDDATDATPEVTDAPDETAGDDTGGSDDTADDGTTDTTAAEDGGDDTAADGTTATTEPEEPVIVGGENLLASAPDGEDTCTEDRVGGELTFGLARATESLDPTRALGSGVAGGIEIAAIYDTLILYDAESGAFLPHIAESVVANDDLSQWTVTLRDDVFFGNGDPLTTEAVEFSFERMKTATVSSAGLASAVVEMEIVDDQTIIFTLDAPSASFLYVLAEDAGNITNPNVVNAMDADEFNVNPNGAGAGPFEVASFVPGEELVLTAKDDYWGGPVCIETLRLVHVPGSPATYDALTLGELDAAFLRDAFYEVQQLEEQGGYNIQGSITNGEIVYVLNVGREGTDSPMQDVRLRQAAAAAIDAELIDERVNEGLGIPGTALVADQEPWSPGIPGPQYDPELAASLVEEVKAEGAWDGSVTLLANDSPQSNIDTAIVMEALLEDVGFDVEVELAPPGEVRTRVIEEANFDIAQFGISALEDAPTARYTSYQTGNPRNRTGYGTPEMDAALAELEVALTREEKRAAMAKIQEIWNRDVPSLILAHGQWRIASTETVHGIFISRDVAPMFFDAWIES